jgi:putative copper export protein
MDIVTVLRWLHALAGAAWFGEVIVIVFVLVPTVTRAEPERQRWLLAPIFPRMSRLDSVLIATVLIAGLLLNLAMSGWAVDWETLTTTRWGRSILIGGILGGALGIFHFVAERKLDPMVTEEDVDLDVVIRRLKLIPTVGLTILVVVVSLMVLA